METNIYRVSFGPSRHATPTQPMYWSDIGWRLKFDGVDLPESYEVYFAHPGDTEAKRSIGGPDGALVLNEYLTSGKELLFWVYVPAGENAAHTKYTGRIPVNPRPAASEAEPTPEQADVITQTIAALNAAVEQTAADVEAADLSAQEAAAQADRAEEAQEAAEAAQEAAEAAERNAALSETAAGESEAAARTYAQNAARSESNAEGYAEDAMGSANLADERSRDAADSAEAAAGKAGEAGAAKEAILNMGATATTLPEGSTATVTKSTDQQGAVTLEFGIPRGATGATGPQGETGPQGPQGDDYVLTAADKAEIAVLVDGVFITTVSGTDPEITAEANHRYVAGTVSTISITPPASGSCEVIFTSGSPAAVLTLPQTVKMPDWWDDVEADYTYDIIITDGVYGGVMAWALA